MIAAILLIVCSVFWIIFSFVTKTKNFVSSVVFKVIPFATGMIVLGIALGMLGVINIPV